MAKRITITDVALSAGVSVGTVSRVLNQREGSIRISEATRKHVLDVAEELGYQANVFASALRTDRTGVIGVIIRNMSDPF
ncbi:MAG: LacI family transcriptional regulator [Anaerolineae bacterium]|nr:LacI family transcriptional regulator [Anaerolineae bacterium]